MQLAKKIKDSNI